MGGVPYEAHYLIPPELGIPELVLCLGKDLFHAHQNWDANINVCPLQRGSK